MISEEVRTQVSPAIIWEHPAPKEISPLTEQKTASCSVTHPLVASKMAESSKSLEFGLKSFPVGI